MVNNTSHRCCHVVRQGCEKSCIVLNRWVNIKSIQVHLLITIDQPIEVIKMLSHCIAMNSSVDGHELVEFYLSENFLLVIDTDSKNNI